MDRDNVTPSYLSKIRVLVLNETANIMNVDVSTHNWVNDALSNKEVDSKSVISIVKKRYGEKVVSYDPSDIESNKRAIAKGYTLVHGRQLNKEQWENIRKCGAILPAGKVTPTPKPFSNDPNAKPLRTIDRNKLSESEIVSVLELEKMASQLINNEITIIIADDPNWGFKGSFSKDSMRMVLNRYSLKYGLSINEELLALFIHELGHYYSSDHLSTKYYDALCLIGAKLYNLK